jgi:hypothetical protein
VQVESNQYGLCHDYVGGSLDAIEAYPANELAGISPVFLPKIYGYIEATETKP